MKTRPVRQTIIFRFGTILRGIIAITIFLLLPPLSADDRIAIFVRESPEGDWDSMRSTIWECVVPEKQGFDARFTRKLDFGIRHWSPSLFFFQGPKNWLRIQKNLEGNSKDFQVSLVSVDYHTWQTREHLIKSRLNDIGFTASRGYLRADDNTCYIVDFPQSTVTPLDNGFRLYRDNGKYWLVQFDQSDKNHYHLIDPDSAEKIHLIDVGEELKLNLYHCDLSEDGEFFALCIHQPLGTDVSFGETSRIRSVLHIWNYKTGRSWKHSFANSASAGSGFHTLAHFQGEFQEENYVFRSLSDSGASRISKLNLDTGEVSHKDMAAFPNPFRQREKMAVPDYLKAEFDKQENAHWPYQTLAHVFVMKFSELQYEIPTTWSETRIAWSKDNTRFLMNMRSNQYPKGVFYGNLDTQELRIFPCPDELERRALEFHFLD